ncbi:hypothetical protein [Natronorubrum bangense]|uniref:hypothetical protein n=1 Tax=Natronorubrum bangense TaxID=61858 RepID=UPI0010A4C9E8|nr:hypothetical protein [Natronorubrum bangense]
MKSNLKGEVGAVTTAKKATDGGKTVRKMDDDIETPKGNTDIDVKLSDGTAIEVKNFDYADVTNRPQFMIDDEVSKLTAKLEKYSVESDSVVVATRGNPESAEIPQRALNDADISDGTTVEFKNIEDIDQL